jgi:hypothetical protein
MKHNTFEPCKDHENGHFGWCLLCENEQKWNFIKQQADRIRQLEEQLKWTQQQATKLANSWIEENNLRLLDEMKEQGEF